MKNKSSEIFVLAAFIALIVAARLLPHTPNFTPVASVALFSGYFFRGGMKAATAVLVGMILSDAVLGFYDIRIMGTVYVCFLLPVLLHPFVQGRAYPLRVAIGSLLSSTVFFLGTNVAVWMFSGMYAVTFSGLRDCFVAAVPFARFTYLGDLFWSTILFGTYHIALYLRHQYSKPARVGVSFA